MECECVGNVRGGNILERGFCKAVCKGWRQQGAPFATGLHQITVSERAYMAIELIHAHASQIGQYLEL